MIGPRRRAILAYHGVGSAAPEEDPSRLVIPPALLESHVRLLARGGVSLDARDPTHDSTPLGWAAFGSVHRRARGGDYAGVVDRLVAAGADVTAVGNRNGSSLLQMAAGNPAMQAALRRHGAS